MKKILFGTTAVALVAASTSAFAAEEITMGISGGWTGGFLFGDNEDDNERSANFVQTSEMAFKGSTKLDNGITVDVTIELEGESSSSDQIDDSNITFKTENLGNIDLGGENMALDDFDVGLDSAVPGGSVDAPDFAGADMPSILGGIAGETPGIVYSSPKFFDFFNFGIGYQTDAGEGDKVTGFTSEVDDSKGSLISVGAGISHDFGGFSFAFSGGFESLDYDSSTTASASDEATLYSFGGKLGFGGFTFKASMSQWDLDFVDPSAGAIDTVDDRTAWGLSLMYEMDALSFSLGYAEEEQEQSKGTTTDGNQAELQAIEIAVGYDMGAGVSIGAGVTFFDNEDSLGATTSTEDGFYGLITTSVDF